MSKKMKAEVDKRIEVEKTLRLSEARYRVLFENTGTAIALIASDGNILLTNDEFVRLTGYSKYVLEHHFNFLGLVTPGDRDRIRQLREDRLAHPALRPQSYEFRLVDRQGSEKSVLSTATVLPGSKSTIISLIDISQRKIAEFERENAIRDLTWAEEELRRQNENLAHAQIMIEAERQRYRDLFDSDPDAYLVTTVEGRISEANRAASSLLGSSPHDLNGSLLIDFLKGKDRRTFRARLARMAAEPGYATAGFHDWEVSMQRQDRGLIDVSIAVTIVSGRQGEPASLRWFLRDLSAAKRAQNALQKSEAPYKHAEEALQKANDQLFTLLQISQSIVSTLDLDRVLALIIEQLTTVMPSELAAVLILEQDYMKIRVIRGPSVFDGLLKYRIPLNEPTLVEPFLKGEDRIYVSDLQADKELAIKLQDVLNLPYAQFENLRSWLVLPLVARWEMIGILLLAHSKPDYYFPHSQNLFQQYANQVAIAIQNAQLYREAHILAALEERNRLARELHDSVTQTLYSISLFTNATRLALESNKLEVVAAHLQELMQLSRKAMSDMRLLIFELRPPVLERDGLVAALQSRLDSVETRAGFQSSLYTEGELHLSAEEESELYRIAQEALDNVIKHAQASHVRVELIGREGSTSLTIMDDGVGFDPETVAPRGGQGFRNIRERAEHIGAACSITSAPDQGTKITIEVQNNEPERHDQSSHR